MIHLSFKFCFVTQAAKLSMVLDSLPALAREVCFTWKLHKLHNHHHQHHHHHHHRHHHHHQHCCLGWLGGVLYKTISRCRHHWRTHHRLWLSLEVPRKRCISFTPFACCLDFDILIFIELQFQNSQRFPEPWWLSPPRWKHWLGETYHLAWIMSRCWCQGVDVEALISSCWCQGIDVEMLMTWRNVEWLYEYAPYNVYKEMVYCELKMFFCLQKYLLTKIWYIFYHYLYIGGQSIKGTAMGSGKKRFFEPEYRPAAAK